MLTATIRETFSRPSAWVYLLLVCGGVAAGALVAAASLGLDTTFDVSLLALPSDLAAIVVIAGAAMLASSPHTRGHIGYAYLARHNRGLEHALRITLIVVAFVVVGVLGMALGYLGLTAIGVKVDLATFSDRANAGGYVWAAVVRWAVFAALSAATAVMLRSAVGAMIVWIADFLILETALIITNTEWSQALLTVLPTNATQVIGLGEVSYSELTVPAATGVIIAWVAILGLAGYAIIRRRPVA